MDQTIDYADLLLLIEERSAAFRTALHSAPSFDVQVPSCPEWTLHDLVQHLGNSQRRWAVIVDAGPADAPPPGAAGLQAATDAPRERNALLAWSAERTGQLLSALRESGPNRACWTWWGRSESPQTCGAVARHQAQHVTVHTYDAQLTAGRPQPLPEPLALDGVEEFLSTSCAGTYPWPHQPAAVDYHASEGSSWRLSLSAAGARTARLPQPTARPAPTGSEPSDAGAASLRGTASELVLALYGRIPVDALRIDGDRQVFDQLLAWDPDE